LGATYKGRSAGTLGDAGAFSTDAGKVLSTGEGGMVVTGAEAAFKYARSYHDHGHEYGGGDRGAEPAICAGFNFRMTELQGAIGLEQLKKLPMILERQRANKAALRSALDGLPVEFRHSPDADGDAGDTLAFFLPDRDTTNKFVAKMTEAEIGSKNVPDGIRWHFSRYWPHLFGPGSPHHEKTASEWQVSADILDRTIALGVAVKMTSDEIHKTAADLKRIAKGTL
jgi:8-amino-3,8-dideoxy-alpha-D-manno-octulosonate transaminase